MPDSICRLTVAACADDEHCAVDLALPSGLDVGQLLPQIVEIVRGDTARSMWGRDWTLTRLGDVPMDESMSLRDNGVRDGDVVVLETVAPPPAEWIDCDPCHILTAHPSAPDEPALRIAAVICCVLLGGCGAAALALSGHGVVTGTCVFAAAAVGAAVLRRRREGPLVCVPLSVIAVLYAGAVGYLIVPPGPILPRLLLAASAAFAVAIVLLRMIDCGRTCLTALATLSALIAAVSAAGTVWTLELTAYGAALATASLAVLGFAPRIAMALTGVRPSTPLIDSNNCHRTLTGLVVGASTTAAAGAASVAAGTALRDVIFAAVVALAVLLRTRTHVDPVRRVGLVAAAVLTAAAVFVAITVSVPTQAHVVSVVAATVGGAALSSLARPSVSPIVVRTVEVAECLVLAAVVPLACWVGGLYP